ncbi:MAG: tyrosine-protein phosphatase [Atopobiaceae bacterium]|nr:tyrosine-protein phosphatase [Atopobiaceae bacterium]
MEPHEEPWKRLPLYGAHNVRDLGGYPTLNGGRTQYRRFLRADGLSGLSAWDVRFLQRYGVRAVIDLRDASEVQHMPDVSLGADVMYANIPLLSYNAADIERFERLIAAQEFSMTHVYEAILENYEGVRACFKFMAEAPEGCILFHCAVGKDRTGILAMLLLSLAGVDKWDIVADYMQSWAHLMRDEAFREDWLNEGGNRFREGMTSDPKNVEHALDLLEIEHGSVEDYLLECGVPDEDVASVRQRLLA